QLARVQDNSGVLKDVVKADMKMADNDHRKFRDMPWRIYGPKKVDRVRPIFSDYGMTAHQFACKWLLQHSEEMTAITATLLDEKEIKEVVAAQDFPDFAEEEMRLLHELYERDFGLPAESHACDLKSSVTDDGKTRSEYAAPPAAIA
ncbi:MAG: hypothetical protein AAGK78_07605, partial [Planctomycetota bacterium]